LKLNVNAISKQISVKCLLASAWFSPYCPSPSNQEFRLVIFSLSTNGQNFSNRASKQDGWYGSLCSAWHTFKCMLNKASCWVSWKWQKLNIYC